MSDMNEQQLKQAVVDFAVRGVEQFLQEHPGLEFYAFAFDCNAEYGEVNLCLNTEADFEETLRKLQASAKSESYSTGDYQSAGEIRGVRYNTGNWEYQCFDTMYAFPDQQGELSRKMAKRMLTLFQEALRDFTRTEAYQKIPKTPGFLVYCIDHDEDVDDALRRVESPGTSPDE